MSRRIIITINDEAADVLEAVAYLSDAQVSTAAKAILEEALAEVANAPKVVRLRALRGRSEIENVVVLAERSASK